MSKNEWKIYFFSSEKTRRLRRVKISMKNSSFDFHLNMTKIRKNEILSRSDKIKQKIKTEFCWTTNLRKRKTKPSGCSFVDQLDHLCFLVPKWESTNRNKRLEIIFSFFEVTISLIWWKTTENLIEKNLCLSFEKISIVETTRRTIHKRNSFFTASEKRHTGSIRRDDLLFSMDRLNIAWAIDVASSNLIREITKSRRTISVASRKNKSEKY